MNNEPVVLKCKECYQLFNENDFVFSDLCSICRFKALQQDKQDNRNR